MAFWFAELGPPNGALEENSRSQKEIEMSYTLMKKDSHHPDFPSISNLFPNLEAWSVGFDREWRLLDELQSSFLRGSSSYPPYNIKQLSEDRYEIEMAVAGFSKSELRLELHNNKLLVEGSKAGKQEDSNSTYIYQGIAGRQFRQTFALADHVRATGSELRDGILRIELERDLPEEKKPQFIEIN